MMADSSLCAKQGAAHCPSSCPMPQDSQHRALGLSAKRKRRHVDVGKSRDGGGTGSRSLTRSVVKYSTAKDKDNKLNGIYAAEYMLGHMETDVFWLKCLVHS